MPDKPDYDILPFASAAAWEKWLAKHHAKAGGVWIRFYKKHTGTPTVTYAEALDVALCYGWIDGQLRRENDETYIQKFTPRRARSIWSKRNTEHVARLIDEGRMKPSGQARIDAAKADGRWDAAYESPANTEMPDDFLKAVARNKMAKATFDKLTRANRFAIAYRLQSARRPETRERRKKAMLDALAAGETINIFSAGKEAAKEKPQRRKEGVKGTSENR
ncbi:YdeI/OmpD-associated family protein [bacterium]|nr:YdeI/OmpD-associated family protein [bacterium]